MIEIYKKLPGTNCGECGESTCLAFALKVVSTQAKIHQCPHVQQEDAAPAEQKRFITMENNYKRVSKELEEEIKLVNFKEAAETIGGNYESRNRGGIITIKMMNRIYEVRKEGLFENDNYCQDSWSKIIVYDYVRRMGSMPLTGEWVSLGHFPDAASHSKAFQKNAEDKISEKFNRDLNGLILRCRELGGIETGGKLNADYVCSFSLLPCVPLYLCFWDADDEYPASCKLYVDRSAGSYIDIEYLAYLLEWFVRIFVE